MEPLISMNLASDNEVWPITSDGYFKNRISSLLISNDIPKEAVDSIFLNAVDILSQCPDPNAGKPRGDSGIVIGKVQSGKTSNFISLMALALDNDYDIMIVLGGNKNNLLAQNTARVEQSFGESDRLVVLDTNRNKTLFNPSTIKRFLDRGSKVIIMGLKHQKHINFIADLFNDEFLKQVPTLIIDDEGDQASLNTQVSKNKISAVYGSIIKLKEKISLHCFISVTATPQANILIDITDLLSPSFGVLVYPGDKYCGLSTFHGEDQDKYIKVIPEEEPSLLDEGFPSTFFEALAVYFIGGSLRQFRGDLAAHSMLIHPSQKKYDHKIVIEKVTNVLDDWRTISSTKSDGIEDINYQVLKRHLTNAYSLLKSEGVNLPRFVDIEMLIIKNILECSPVHLYNSDEPANDNDKYYKFNIYVGGNMVERGITIKGLAVTYITRRAKGISNVDNTEQRARWFGYKEDYLDVCRVYTTKGIKKDFDSILEHDDDLWATIERAQEKGTPFKEIPRIFKLANEMLRMTRVNVAKTVKGYQFSEWTKQEKFLFDEMQANSNLLLLEELKSHSMDTLELIILGGVNKHKVLRNINFFDLKRNILDRFVFPNKSKIDRKFFNTVEELFHKCDFVPLIDVMWIRDGVGETRTINDDQTVTQLFQGRNPNKNSPTYYAGDSAMPNGRDVMQLQIHYVQPKNYHLKYTSPMLALYIPNVYSAALTKFVIKA
ncbi:Z1 domain-containing protein [Paenibacillus sp. FSL R7-0210]|uniref:Z1 domain-containing protein n=1 Tax=Paenibacillus sp. FSL R7-0210 TaxID=2921676 RepID=UPI0030F9CB0B